ncbi:unnamed protein product [Peronospora destructor]|uniref:Uncharacterized protein n=1 Tax=Peronospora destructor TaxID=86335 RepID=A0AAV0V415_9STRA|nr:unnamed protein product [Peronospora destructor]
MGSAGIAEVELPTSYTEKTEKATRKALESMPTLIDTGSDYVAEMKSLNKDERHERGFHQVGQDQASDDRAVSRFRKFESRQVRR